MNWITGTRNRSRSLAAAVAVAATIALALPASALAQTVTFGPGYTTWTVPAGVTFLTVTVAGASGGYDGASPSACTPGTGMTLTASYLPVTGGQLVHIAPGTQGGNGSASGAGGAAGFPGGAAGGSAGSGDDVGGGGGGGYSIVYGASASQWYADAAGGGGCGGLASANGGNGGNGDGDGAAGSGGPNGAAGAGLGGRNGATGGANVPANGQSGTAGSSNQAGAGGGSTLYAAGGGGGGGGITGGGGGGAAATGNGSAGGGGGGGSYLYGSYAGSWNFALATMTGDGWVTITYTPPPAPSASTGSASGVTDTAATAAGSVNPNGEDTTYYIDYGSSTAYGQQTPETSAGSGSGASPVSVALSGLAPGTVYHYRVVATSVGGVTDGQDQTFTTVAPPGAVTSPPTAVSDTAATLAGVVNPYGLPTTYAFEYGTTQSYGQDTPSVSAASGASPQAVTADISGLQPQTVYHYRLLASRGSDVTEGPDQMLRTPGVPAASTGPASNLAQTAALVSGTVNPDGHQTTYHFEFGLSTKYGQQTVEVATGDGISDLLVSQELGGLQPGTRYHYRLVATSASGTADGPDATFVTASPPPNPHISFLGKPIVHGNSIVYVLTCARARCRVTATLTSAGGVRIGSRTLTIAPGHRQRLTLSLNATGRRMERRVAHLRAILKISLAGASGHLQLVETVTVKFARH